MARERCITVVPKLHELAVITRLGALGSRAEIAELFCRMHQVADFKKATGEADGDGFELKRFNYSSQPRKKIMDLSANSREIWRQMLLKV